MRNETLLDAVQKDGSTARAHLEAKVKRRADPDALAQLVGPPFPDALAYLEAWSRMLYGRSGVGMNGLAPLSYPTIAEWARLMDLTIQPHEVDALLLLDGIRAHPDSWKPEPDE